jgi:hypothetical protein
MRSRCVAEVIELQARLNARRSIRPIDGDDSIEILGRVDDDRFVAALTGDARASASPENGGTMRPTYGKRHENIVDAARDDDPYRTCL